MHVTTLTLSLILTLNFNPITVTPAWKSRLAQFHSTNYDPNYEYQCFSGVTYENACHSN